MIIAVSGGKGGAGRTTTAFHLAAYWASKGLDTVLIDGDPNRSAIEWVRASKGDIGFEVIDQLDQVSYFMERTKKPQRVIVDMPARPTLDDLKSLVRSNALFIIPSMPDAISMWALPGFLNRLADIRAKCDHRILITSMPPKPATDGQDAIAYLKKQGFPVFNTGIRRYLAFARATLEGVPVCDIPRGEAGWADYVAIGEECDRILGTTAEPASTLSVASEQR